MSADDHRPQGETRGASCGARVCSTDYTHGPHRHENGVTVLIRDPRDIRGEVAS